jgi:hypothetical protein
VLREATPCLKDTVLENRNQRQDRNQKSEYSARLTRQGDAPQ